jgi:hypothetical protein
MIGSIDAETLLTPAKRLVPYGGKPVADSVLVSSGGTTGTPKLTYVPHHMALTNIPSGLADFAEGVLLSRAGDWKEPSGSTS